MSRKKKSKKINLHVREFMRMHFNQAIKRATLVAGLISFPFFIGNMIESKRTIAGSMQQNEQHTNSDGEKLNTDFQKIHSNITDTKPDTHSGISSNVMRIGYVDLTNTGILYVTSGTTLASEGSVVTTATGNTRNNGEIYLKGDWINTGTYTYDNGKVTFWDTDDQVIDGNASAVFYNSVVNKSAGTVYMNTPVEIVNRLTLTDGIVDLNGQKLTLSNSLTTAISYVDGYLISEQTDNSSKVQWNMGSTTGAHVIPFGTQAGTIIPLTLDQTAGDIGNVTVSTYGTIPNNTPYPVTPDSVHHLRNNTFSDNSANVVDRFWQINKTGASGTLTITFTYANTEEPSTGDAGLVAQVYSVPYKAWMAPFGSQSSNAATNTVTAPGVSLFGPFVLSKTTSPLPIQLLAFDAKLNKENDVDLTWTTLSEINNSHFIIERTNDMQNIEAIDHIPGAGNSTGRLDYETTDKYPLSGNSYYRLKQIDFDGNFSTSEWKHIYLGDKENILELSIDNVYPNPFSEEFTVEYSVLTPGETMFQLLNENAQEIFSDKVIDSNGKNTYHYSAVNELAQGIYYFNIIHSGQMKTFKLIKKK